MPVIWPQQQTKSTAKATGAAPSQTVAQQETAPLSTAEAWGKLSQDQREEVLKNMTSEETERLADELGWHGHATSVRARPGPFTIAGLKERAYDLVRKGSSYLPMAGGVGGGLLGEAIEPAGGGIPGAYIGGGAGEVVRQSVLHAAGLDKDEPQTWGQRASQVATQAAYQELAELFSQGMGRMLRPTTKRAINKLFAAGGLGKEETGALEQVMDDLVKTEKVAGNKATTIGDFLNVIETTKRDIGNEVDLSMAQKVLRGGKMVPLGDADAVTTGIVDHLNALKTAHPSEAELNPAKMALFKQRALIYSKPRTFKWLTDRRIVLNSKLQEIYRMAPGEQRVAMLKSGELEADKAEADAIRDIIYPEMDIASGRPAGTTAKLQGKRGALISLSNATNDNIKVLQAKTHQAAGSAWYERGNLSEYGTTGGRPGIAAHRLGSMVHAPNYTARASQKVSSAFGHTIPSKIAKAASTPVGMEVMALPLRYLATPDAPAGAPGEDEDQDVPMSLKELRDEAQRRKPPAAPPGPQSFTQPYTHVFNEQTGRIEAA